MLAELSYGRQVRVPADFAAKGKPHLTRAGEWVLIAPTTCPIAIEQLQAVFGPYLRKMNGFVDAQPTSFRYSDHLSMQ